ncbi:STM4012 family radical SAM protein [Embleya scabrispora]|uniref:STM4012 family radical SAM protein n=1 Tax=Embleya scabrispora TaxID=159449 RepID=UPI0003688D2B|nr:STM4012 family radical SAM protein [Embleya scabrispora]MYS84889.1 coproporphyrinogen III oxidase family protein [Streptomyces sp. SID5474]
MGSPGTTDPASPPSAVADLLGSPYAGYVYSYPHKTAYRPLDPEPALSQVWRGRDLSALFLYLHIPFCEMRCGFCNLFTRTGAPQELVGRYLDALERQARAVREAIPDARFAIAAVGGGTPTYLDAPELERLFDIATEVMGADLGAIATSVETSPATATPERLKVLAARGTTRVSIGVQSFDDAEARAVGRPQRRADVEAALTAIRDAALPILNIDLIYGIDGQTRADWLASIDAALAWEPEELYLYPLYVRPLTGLGRRAVTRADWDTDRLALYRAGRDRLREAGYEQVSMRMFRRADAPTYAGGAVGGESGYRCQRDGMIGLGCGARSYTSDLHYSFEYAVGIGEVRAIIDDYVTLDQEAFTRARVGYRLDAGERRRRYLLTSLLQADGLAAADYRAAFGTDAAADFAAELARPARAGLLTVSETGVRLTEEGLAWSDAIGPALFSPETAALMHGYRPR